MNIQEIIRAWRDSAYRESLTEEQRMQLPENPIGEPLSEEELDIASGRPRQLGSYEVCPWTNKDSGC